jgi:hypothetical protein
MDAQLAQVLAAEVVRRNESTLELSQLISSLLNDNSNSLQSQNKFNEQFKYYSVSYSLRYQYFCSK